MTPLAKALRLWHTVRFLKPVQVYGRVRFRLSRPTPDLRPAPAVRAAAGPWVLPARREPSLVSASQMRFLGEERDLDQHGWDDPGLAKLWRYNQHYFDDLAAVDAGARTAWHRELIARWIDECPPGRGTAWEPYPTSLRIVNWIKWLRAGNEPVPAMLNSLAAQTRFLTKRLEWHLLGNHLFVNAKALVIAGLHFEGDEADAWRATGWRILRAEIPEQILDDGGQFERSPMYHALAVEDMLDLANAMRAAPGVCAGDDERRVTTRLAAMRRFLAGVCHPDGEVSFFNDSAQGVAPTRAELEGYAARLGLEAAVPEPAPASTASAASAASAASTASAASPAAPARGVAHFPTSGFIRVEHAGSVAILDVGPVGPDYLPGHAHADTLSFELSVAGRRVLVNSGTSQYGVGPERLRQRGTAAHNTVVVDGQDSSEVWGGFRVARRARVTAARITDADPTHGGLAVECSHDGYQRLPGGGVHRRTWTFLRAGDPRTAGAAAPAVAHPGGPNPASPAIEVRDHAEPAGKAESHWHFAPGCDPVVSPDGRTLTATAHGITFQLTAEGAEWRVSRSTYSPRFGASVPNQKAVARFTGAESIVRIEWSPCTSSS